MKANLGMADKIVRILAAALIVTLYFTNVIAGVTAIILLIVAAILIFTSLFSFCPIYYFLGIRTKRKTIQS